MTIPLMSHGAWYKLASDQLVFTGDGVVLAILIANGTSGAQFELNDSTDGGGADFIAIVGTANETQFLDFSRLGGIPFVTGCWIDWTAGTVYICLDK
jgi:hypothetical protein